MNRAPLAAFALLIFCSADLYAYQFQVEWKTPPQTITIANGHPAPLQLEGLISNAGSYDAILALDSSGSMTVETGATAPNGGSQVGDWVYSAAKSLVADLNPRIRLGLLDFNSGTDLLVDVEQVGSFNDGFSHRQKLLDAIDSIKLGGNTNLVRAVKDSADHLLSFQVNPDVEQNIILVSDGRPHYRGRYDWTWQTQSDVEAEVKRVLGTGVDALHTIGYPNSDVTFLRDLAELGNGVYGDGSDLNDVGNVFAEVFGSIEAADRLDIILPDSSVLNDVEFGLDGSFSLDTEIHEGDNLFTARVTSTTGSITEAEVNIIGVAAVPEPNTGFVLSWLGLAMFARRRRR